jgi:hypothetical protein
MTAGSATQADETEVHAALLPAPRNGAHRDAPNTTLDAATVLLVKWAMVFCVYDRERDP